jgi:hypothetical protein
MAICVHCRLIHSDWVSCERAKYTGEYEVPLHQELLATLERIDPPAKPVFDKYAHLAKARAARRPRS